VYHGASEAQAATVSTASTVTLSPPSAVVVGDLLVAYIYLGSSIATALPVITPPAGWTLLDRADDTVAGVGSLAVYAKIASTGDPLTYTWTSDYEDLYASWILAYGGVDPLRPVDSHAISDDPTAASAYTTPALAMGTAGERAVAAFAGYVTSKTPSSWSAPASSVQRVNFNNSAARSASADDWLLSASGSVGPVIATATPAQTYALLEILTLNPCQ
jgi:hypothetical protein